jgi:flagellar motility protein MotE (MotC chaperone)
MLRLLPYLLVLLVCLFFSKLMNVMEEYVGILNVQESKAQLPKPDLKKEEPDNSVENSVENLKGPNVPSVPLDTTDNFQLSSEKQLLQQLRQRRKEIESYKDKLPAEKMALESIKQYIDNRLNMLENVQNQLRPQLHNNNQNDDKKIQKLVKVYESMKPKEAAKIFNDLQIGVLVELALNMKESRLAAILSEMTPEKARELTSILATQSDMGEF